MSRLTVDGDLVRQARLTSGNSRAELARMVGVSVQTVTLLENNTERTAQALTVERLERLAEALTVDPFALLSHAEPPPVVATDDQDVARLLAALVSTTQPLRPADVLAVFGWPRERLAEAVAAANTVLRDRTILIAEGARGLRLRAADSSGHDDAARIIAAVATTEGLDSSYMKVLHRFWSGKTAGSIAGRRSRSAIALLSRLGLLHTDDDGLHYRASDALEFAFPDDDDLPHD